MTWQRLPKDIVYAVLSYADIPLNVLACICKWTAEHARQRPLHIDCHRCGYLSDKLLQSLNLNSITLRSLRDVDLISLTRLTSLDVSDGYIYAPDLAQLTTLRCLSFVYNKRIEDIHINMLTQLESIHVNNAITSAGISKMTSLTAITINTNITDVTMFSSLRCLRASGPVKFPPSVNCLHLDNNNHIKLKDIYQIRTLSIHGETKITKLGKLTSLRTLDLTHNSITHDIPSCVTSLTMSPGRLCLITSPLIVLHGCELKEINGKKYATAGTVRNSKRVTTRKSMYVWS